jgi:hypothetical protein
VAALPQVRADDLVDRGVDEIPVVDPSREVLEVALGDAGFGVLVGTPAAIDQQEQREQPVLV